MAEKEKPPKAWTPADPLEDDEEEEKAQSISKARARVNYLVDQYSKPPKKSKGSFNPFSE